MDRPKEISRLTIADIGNRSLPTSGVYIITYTGGIMYVGRTDYSIESRLNNHMTRHDAIGNFLWDMRNEWDKIRIDILEPPLDDAVEWMTEVEKKAIAYYNPLFNTEHNPARSYSKEE